MKAYYEGITFDSELEVEYYKHLKDLVNEKLVYEFIYHPNIPIQITDKNTYTPDFIVGYEDRIEIIETKGFNQFSYMRDNMVHNVMLNKSEEELREWLAQNNILWKGKIEYKKIKYMKQFGWVNFEFKNPNTLANKRKEKINLLEQELKELRLFKKDTIKYFKLSRKALTEKLTNKQKEFRENYRLQIDEVIKNGTE